MDSDAALARASGKGRLLASINYFGDCLWQLARPQPLEPNAGFSARKTQTIHDCVPVFVAVSPWPGGRAETD